jgi:hypothetical protein
LPRFPPALLLRCRTTHRNARQGARRYGTDEAPPIDWLLPPRTWGAATPSDGALSEMFAYHSVTMANTVRAPLLVFSRWVVVGARCAAHAAGQAAVTAQRPAQPQHHDSRAAHHGAPTRCARRQGNMPALLSHYRPNSTIFAFTGEATAVAAQRAHMPSTVLRARHCAC